MPRFLMPLLALTLAGCNSHSYHREALQYHAAAQDVLIARGICTTDQDCGKKGLLFIEGGSVSLGLLEWGGAYVTLYETSDAPLVDEVTAKLQQLHGKLKEPKVTFTVFSSKHLEPKVQFRKVVIE
ncbi:MAG: hypothetical protein KA751_15255 [Comamonas sp.]|nr:hypothetical protein [Comamonas sp.]